MKKILMLLVCCLPLNLFANPSTITVVLDWFINPNHAPLFVAEQEGIFKKMGLDVKWIVPSDPTAPAKLVAMGQADIALDYQMHLELEQTKRLGLKQVGILIPGPLNCLVTLKKNNIKNLRELRGKKIAYSSPAIDMLLLNQMLQRLGITLKDVTLINVHFGLTQALLSGRVDAAIGMMRNYEPIQLAQMGYETIVFYPEKNGVKTYHELIFVSKSAANDPKIKLFLKGVNEGVKHLKNNPEASWNKFAKAHPELNNNLNHEVWRATVSKFQLQDPL